ncbi:unnamed protein product [Didymodactylos carnosus]|uniref:Uncharacterized protein n=1 Tax=Didymodactylos carnosus TaxID=1234261 RepID=A0A814TB04_9BILA|nr:unnamed protein product [Didymodactylos carnosus]CAF1219825.1 unnamed protein product [Didymodactylos carnosus]CAF3921771.1 unnamed protein product [Didymodactylos carnosus]CAF4027919.1 unnamed protein product [Didymodactylos carnosus]
MHYCYYSILILTIVFHCTIVKAQQFSICAGGQPTSVQDPRWYSVPSRFEIIGEITMADGAFEVSQTFSANRDAIYLTIRGQTIQHYYYYDTNEYFTISHFVLDDILTPICARTAITDQFATSNISQTVVKPSILLGYDSRNNENQQWGTRFQKETTIRGIPVDVFQACFYVPDIQTTIEATYYISIFCRNRTNTLGLPKNLPDRLSINTELLIPFNNYSIVSGHETYDKHFQFVKYDVYLSNQQHQTEIHDYNTGLTYRYEHQTKRCTVGNITTSSNDAVAVDDHPNFVRMRDGPDFLLLNDIDFHYAGIRQCRDHVQCHVWIGEKPHPDNKGFEHREWYWAFEVNNIQLSEFVPLKMIISELNFEGKKLSSVEVSMFNFNRNPNTIYEIDRTLADCYRAMGPSNGYNYVVILFKLNNDKQYPVQQNIRYLQLQIWQTMTSVLNLRPIRLSNILIDPINKDLLVSMTLLDVPPTFGPVENPINELKVNIILEQMHRLINNNELAFRAKYDTKEVLLRVRPQSLGVLLSSGETYKNFVEQIPQHRNQTVPEIIIRTRDIFITKHSGPKITAFIFGFMLLGLVLTVAVGTIVLHIKKRK